MCGIRYDASLDGADNPRGTSRGQKDGVIRLMSGMLDGGENVFALKAGIVLQDLFDVAPGLNNLRMSVTRILMPRIQGRPPHWA
jgi:hypothetical protein